MSIIIGTGKPKSDWLGLELISGKTIYAKFPFDPFGEIPDEIPQSGIIRVDSEVFVVMKTMVGPGQIKMGLATFRSDAGEGAEPPYFIRADHISVIKKLSTDCQLYEIFAQQSSDLIVPKSSLFVP